MGFFVFDKLQKLWSFWDLRAFVLLSLFLQFFLVFASPFRKKTSNAIITSLIWLAYLSADWAATFAVGIMSHGQGDTSADKKASDLIAFWAPFLINHLGGPDTITAFSLEDNELWLRHFLQLVSQLAATGYVFYKSLPTNELLAPTILMFIAGLIKYGEKTNSLYHASVNKFRNSLMKPRDPGPNYAKLVEEYGMRDDARMPVSIKLTKEPKIEFRFGTQIAKDENQSGQVQDAFMFFNMFKGQVADLVFRKHEGKRSQDYFIDQKPEHAFKVVELELNYIYDVLYTKMGVIQKRVGYFFRFVSFLLVLVSFFLWHSMDKSPFERHDVKITYTLLFGAIALDVIAFFMLLLSDWTMARVTFIRQIRKTLAKKFLDASNQRWILQMSYCSPPPENGQTIPFPRVLSSSIFHRRWSETIQQYNLIKSCLNLRNQKVEYLYERLGMKDFLDGNKYVYEKSFKANIRDSIFLELKDKAKMVSDSAEAENIFKARGDWALQHIPRDTSHVSKLKVLETWITKVEYDESLLIWHIATQLCYDCDDIQHNEPQNGADYRSLSIILSNYMLYLLLRQPKMMTEVAGIGQLRFRDTTAEAEKFFDSLDLDPKSQGRQNTACRELLAVDANIPTKEAKGERSKSVLFEGCRLAKKLTSLEDLKWKVIHKVWVEMLGYAAARCSGNAHAAELSKGGQLITFVWLLMVHLGLKKQFLINEDDVGAKLAVG